MAAAGSLLNPTICPVRSPNETVGEDLEAFFVPDFSPVDHVDLQSLQVTGEHPPFGVGESGQIFRTGFAKDSSGEGNEIATLVHWADGGVNIEIEFSYLQPSARDEILPIPGRMDW